ncbi:ABC transporter ATP-binding protein [Thomasclavelia cocleata]|uniref:ATP-binding cassette, subfamily B n=1 Tax=Thomasclavelia cocleata TaxID=69824 RepID=A0A1I0GGC5_9FIRM|nr:ABC transporter ATP-binding protein [Thomasclavelia cocleata]MCR1961929.1 ABC transporter ATP-binding protein/permease [Thomasclavelia cocleata]NDO41551.1 ABC transporter ATP-binding protein [Thomasclavelia cocleata]PJN81325.1 ABC transporter ATP-binding protein [Thomasclavelia cocleata]SET70173.1 ATP-binding cassette, subfamily B [Thomasclavelia cocleata]
MNRKIIKRLLTYCKPYQLIIIVIFVLSFFSVCLTLLTPVLFGRAIDSLIGINQVDFNALIVQLMIIVGVIVVCVLVQWLLGQFTNKITYSITNDLRDKVFEKLHLLPLKYIDSHPHGDIIGRVINDIDLIGNGLLQSFTSLFTGVVTIIGTIIIMCLINLSIAIVVIVLTPLSLLVASIIVKRTHVYFKEQLEIRGEMNGYIEEMIGNQRLIKAFNYEKTNEKRFQEINQRMHVSGVKSQFYGALINPTTRIVNSLVYGAVGVFGAISVLNGHFTVGLLSSFLTYANQYTKPFNEISSVMTEMQTALAASQRVFNLLDEQNESFVVNPQIVNDIQGKVTLKDVCFSYEPNVSLIKDLNLKVKSGQTVAIVGKTGCGKTTLINLLMRFYDQNNGVITIDDVDTLKMDRDYLRKLYGMVLQESWIFKGTIKENIAYGKSDADDEEIIAAAKKARVHKFIMKLPDGYETMIEEDGGNLSQGQKQLICIARIMLTKPPMLILDEATSSIDTRTELQIQEAFDIMMEGRTTFIVAHRLSTIKNADIILFMDKGRILEQGTHQELLDKQGYYYNLYNSQFNLG